MGWRSSTEVPSPAGLTHVCDAASTFLWCCFSSLGSESVLCSRHQRAPEIPGPWIVVPLMMIGAIIVALARDVLIRVVLAAAEKGFPFDLVFSVTFIVCAVGDVACNRGLRHRLNVSVGPVRRIEMV